MLREILETMKGKASLKFSVNTEYSGEVEDITTDLLPYEELIKVGEYWESKVNMNQKSAERQGTDELYYLDIQFVKGDKNVAQKVGKKFDVFPVLSV